MSGDYQDSVSPPDPERHERVKAEFTGDRPASDPAAAEMADDPIDSESMADKMRATADDFFVKRDDEDRIQPVDTPAEGFGIVTVRPMNYGQAEKYFGDAGSIAAVGPDVIAEILRNHVLDPDLEAHCRERFGKTMHGQTHYLNEKVIRDELLPPVPQALLLAILRESGMDAEVEMNDRGEAEVEFQGN